MRATLSICLWWDKSNPALCNQLLPLPSSPSISRLLTVACRSRDVLEVQACGRQRRLFGLAVVDGRETEGERARRPQERERIRKGWKMKNIMWWKQEGEGGNGDLWTAALWAPWKVFGVSRVLSDTRLMHYIRTRTHTHMHTCMRTHCHTPANKQASTHAHTISLLTEIMGMKSADGRRTKSLMWNDLN